MAEGEIQSCLEKLPDPLRREVLDYIQFLIEKHGFNEKGEGTFSFNWEGSLSKLKTKMSSVELQHRVLEWR